MIQTQLAVLKLLKKKVVNLEQKILCQFIARLYMVITQSQMSLILTFFA